MFSKIDHWLIPFGRYAATDAAMRRWGLNNLMMAGWLYNHCRHRNHRLEHLEAYRHRKDSLLQKAGMQDTAAPLKMQDGWALDTSMTLPHLDALLRDAGTVIDACGGREFAGQQYSFMRSLLFPGDTERFASYVDFITSPELLSVAMNYLGTIPQLSKAQPPGIRFMESSEKLDEEPELTPRQSQLYHIDFYDSPQVYVLVALRDITSECGPWTFLPASATDRITRRIGYRERGFGYRVPDEVIRPHIREGEEIAFTGPKGSVLFIDSSRCFHFGSRNSKVPRFMMMYALQSPARCDFAQLFNEHQKFPLPANAPELRRMVTD